MWRKRAGGKGKPKLRPEATGKPAQKAHHEIPCIKQAEKRWWNIFTVLLSYNNFENLFQPKFIRRDFLFFLIVYL